MEVNEIFFIGSNKHGQAGIPEKDATKVYESPRSYDFGVFIKQVSCGYHHSAILTLSGHLYMMGSNIHGTLATKDKALNYTYSPILVENLPQISKIESGAFHICALTQQNTVYSWGRGMDGQLGTGTNKNSSTPQLINIPEKIMDVSCGTNHTIILTTQNIAYAFGNGIYGQLGTGNNKNQSRPVKINLQNISMVAAGDNHSLFLCEGSVFATGDNTSGQTGIVSPKKYIVLPQAIGLEDVSIIQASKFSAAISNGQLYVWGYKSKHLKPHLVESKERFNQMKCGNEMVMVRSSKALYGWKIQNEEPQLQQIQINTSAILDFSVGQNHCLILGDIIRTVPESDTIPLILKHTVNPYTTSVQNDKKKQRQKQKQKHLVSEYEEFSDTFSKICINKQNNHLSANYSKSEQESNIKQQTQEYYSSTKEDSNSVIQHLLKCQRTFEDVKSLLSKSNSIKGGLKPQIKLDMDKQNISNNSIMKEKDYIMILRSKDLLISELQTEISKKQAVILGYEKTIQSLTKMLCVQRLYQDQEARG